MVVCGFNDVVKFVRSAENFNELGITDLKPEINFKNVTDGIKRTTGKIRHVLTDETQQAGVKIVMGTAKLNEGFISVDGKDYSYDKLIIATGSRALIPNVPGAETARTYKDMLKIRKIPEKMIIIGGGTISAEFAGVFSALGSKVYVLCRSRFLKMLDDDTRSYVAQKLLKGVEIHENIEVTEIRPESVSTEEGDMEGMVLLATGMVPNSELAAHLVDTGSRGRYL